ncbi:MAG: hypothetical protein L0Z50_29080 [Verrucomicrobiales bacterium]|nr:hypothetical protein [Verrucomicrobiales bacterium]
MSNPLDARRRWFGLFFLFIALGMLIWGQTILKPHLSGLGFILYWLGCFAFTILAMLTALLDFWIVRHRTREAQRDLLNKAIGPAGKNARQSDDDSGGETTD